MAVAIHSRYLRCEKVVLLRHWGEVFTQMFLSPSQLRDLTIHPLGSSFLVGIPSCVHPSATRVLFVTRSNPMLAGLVVFVLFLEFFLGFLIHITSPPLERFLFRSSP